MFSRYKNFLCRHKKKLVISSVVVGGIVLGWNYMQKKLIEWQERETRNFLKKAQKEHHYQCTLRTCNQTIYSLSIPLKDSILKYLNSEEILLRIRKGEEDRVTLWEEMKVVVFARVITYIYAGTILVLFLRMQLSILGGYIIRGDENVYTSNFQETYLSLCHHFVEKGIHDLCDIIKKHSEIVMKDVSLKQQLSLEDIEQLFWRFDFSLNRDPLNPLKNLSHYVIQETNGTLFSKPGGSQLEGKDRDMIKDVVKETIELLKFNAVHSLTEIVVKRAYTTILDRVAEFYIPPDTTNENVIHDDSIAGLNNVKMALAKVVPIFHGLFNNIPVNGSSDTWIEQFINNERLITLGANIYEGFSTENSSSTIY